MIAEKAGYWRDTCQGCGGTKRRNSSMCANCWQALKLKSRQANRGEGHCISDNPDACNVDWGNLDHQHCPGCGEPMAAYWHAPVETAIDEDGEEYIVRGPCGICVGEAFGAPRVIQGQQGAPTGRPPKEPGRPADFLGFGGISKHTGGFRRNYEGGK